MTTPTIPGAEALTDAVERANEQFRTFGERAQGSVREAGNLFLDQYEKGVATYLELQGKAADAAPAEVFKSAIENHAALVKEINDAYVKAARAALR